MFFIILIVFFIVYGFMNAYFYLSVVRSFSLGPKAIVSFRFFLFAMVVYPLLLRITESQVSETTARVLAYMCYLWMGFIFIFVCINIPIEFYRIISKLGQGDPLFSCQSGKSQRRSAFFVTLCCSLVLIYYGYSNALDPVIERLEIRDSKIKNSTFRIVQISDLHAGVMTDKKGLERVFYMIKDSKPDVLVTTGDFMDRHTDILDEFCNQLSSLNPPYGKYAALGNHELYAGIDESIRLLNKCGFKVLRGQVHAVTGWLYIAGIDDISIEEAGLSTGRTEDELLKEIPEGSYAVLLKHRPMPARCSRRNFNLQISGHTHGGQIFPFNIVTFLFFPLHAGNYQLKCGTFVHVSRGTGTWGPPIRLFSPPEISVIELIPEGKKDHAS